MHSTPLLALTLLLIATTIMDSTTAAEEQKTPLQQGRDAAAEDEKAEKARAMLNGFMAAYDVGTDEDREVMRRHVVSEGKEHPNVYKDLSKHAQTMAVVGSMVSGMEFDCPQCGHVQLGTKCPKTGMYHV